MDCIQADSLGTFFRTMAEPEFDPSSSQEIGASWHEYDRLVSLRKHEHIDPSTFSLLHYDEADLILKRWKMLLTNAEAARRSVSHAKQRSFFELVLYPIKASVIFVTLQTSLGRNQLYALQRRNSANSLFHAVLSLFDDDFSLSSTFHALLNGRWKHIASQPHYGIGPTWHASSRDMISGLSYVQRRQDSNPVAGQMGVCVEGHARVRPGVCNEASDLTHPSRRDLIPGVTLGLMTRYSPQKKWFDVFTRGTIAIHWVAMIPFSWLKLSATSSTLDPDGEDNKVTITIDWIEVPEAFNQHVLVDICSMEGDYEQIHLPINGRRISPPSENIKLFRGSVESDGYISIPASKCPISPP